LSELLWPLPATAPLDDANARDQNKLCMRPISLSSFPAEFSATLWPPFQNVYSTGIDLAIRTGIIPVSKQNTTVKKEIRRLILNWLN